PGGLPIPKDWFATTPLSSADVADDFANLDDLAWLEPIAKSHRVFLFGEAHYFQVTHHLGARVLFALNHYDHYGLVTLELPYSLTPFLDRVATTTDEAAAKSVFEAHLADVVDVETGELLDHIRAWNRSHPKQVIHVSAHDLEFDRSGVARRVLVPYFAALGSSYTIDPAEVRDLPAFVAKLNTWLPAARAKKLITEPGIDADYIARVLANLRSTGNVGGGQGEFWFYRQHAIIRNLTDPAYLGRYFQTGKVMVWAGAEHLPNHADHVDGGNFLREGAYLTFEFPATKGKTYSMNVLGFAYSLGAMAGVDPAALRFVGDGYRDTLRKLHAGEQAGVVAPDRAYVDASSGSTALAMISALDARNGEPMRLTMIAWDKIAAAVPAARDEIAGFRRELENYDTIVLVPRSPIVRRH
ncbi:MAG TPA: hypothetical protein VGO00_23475, partial [Kofleriaceae bacterium]|nr:hypothetical protein [Kofleriaceae bacterium]